MIYFPLLLKEQNKYKNRRLKVQKSPLILMTYFLTLHVLVADVSCDLLGFSVFTLLLDLL